MYHISDLSTDTCLCIKFLKPPNIHYIQPIQSKEKRQDQCWKVGAHQNAAFWSPAGFVYLFMTLITYPNLL